MAVNSYSSHSNWFPHMVLKGVTSRGYIHYIIEGGFNFSQGSSREPAGNLPQIYMGPVTVKPAFLDASICTSFHQFNLPSTSDPARLLQGQDISVCCQPLSFHSFTTLLSHCYGHLYPPRNRDEV